MSQSPIIADLLIDEGASLHGAMQKIDINGNGVVFVVDAAGRLVGVLTDGDIRRALLRNASLASAVSGAMTANCASLPVESKREDILGHLMHNPDFRIVPLVNSEHQPVDYASLRSVHRIPVANPDLAGNEIEYVTSCLRDGWISSQGPFVKRFEEEFAQFLGADRAVATSSGTTALHLALAGLDIGPGDEVIVPDFTFAASINAILYCGATPILIDVDRATWNLDPNLLEKLRTARTKAVMAVHLYGQPAAMDEICAFTQKHGLFLIEDAAEALGARFRDRYVGSIGDAAAFSFFGNKLITTGEGGMVVAKSPEVMAKIAKLRDHGMDPTRRYWHDVVGYNYRMTNLQAAIGVAQLERIGQFIAKKQNIGRRYERLLSNTAGIWMPQSLPNAESVCWLFTVACDRTLTGVSRDDLMARLMEAGIESRPVFYPMHCMPPYQALSQGRSFPAADFLSECGLSLPSAVNMTDGEIDYVVAIVKRSIVGRSRGAVKAGS